jgi:hypothetical protein
MEINVIRNKMLMTGQIQFVTKQVDLVSQSRELKKKVINSCGGSDVSKMNADRKSFKYDFV